ITTVPSRPTRRSSDLIGFDAAWELERTRRAQLTERALPAARAGVGAELTLAADQFVITPATRAKEAIVAKAAGDESRTVIAGYRSEDHTSELQSRFDL